MRVRRWPVVGVALAVLWAFVRGPEPHLDRVVGELLSGLLVGLPVAFVLRRMYRPAVDLRRLLAVAPRAVYYVVVFLWEMVTANVDVAYRVLHPRMPIEPDVVEVPLRVESDAAITSIANSITLTPGTLTMDYDDEANTLYVHGIVGERRDEVLDPIRRWEDLLLVIFDEAAEPGSAPPPRTTDRPSGADTLGTDGDAAPATDAGEDPDGTAAGEGAEESATGDDSGGSVGDDERGGGPGGS